MEDQSTGFMKITNAQTATRIQKIAVVKIPKGDSAELIACQSKMTKM